MISTVEIQEVEDQDGRLITNLFRAVNHQSGHSHLFTDDNPGGGELSPGDSFEAVFEDGTRGTVTLGGRC